MSRTSSERLLYVQFTSCVYWDYSKPQDSLIVAYLILFTKMMSEDEERNRGSKKKTINKSSYQRSSMKKVFLKISQNSLENTCARASFLIKLLKVLSYVSMYILNIPL